MNAKGICAKGSKKWHRITCTVLLAVHEAKLKIVALIVMSAVMTGQL
jgi:hypothetical protein